MSVEKGEKMVLAATMTREGYTSGEIAGFFGVTSRTVKNWRKKMGTESPLSGRPEGRKDTGVREDEDKADFLRPGPRPADMQFSISDEQVVMRCQSIYDCHTPVAILSNEFQEQVGLPKRFKKIYWGPAGGVKKY